MKLLLPQKSKQTTPKSPSEAPVEKFFDYKSADEYRSMGVLWLEPMTAKEIDSEEDQYDALRDPANYIEEKFDGTRALVHFFSRDRRNTAGPSMPFKQDGFCRVFSRRVSKQTGWFCENTDSVPQIRDIDLPHLDGTVIDGEMFIPGRPFKDVAGILNCTYDEAVRRQRDRGNVVLHAFDILYYKGKNLMDQPLYDRKEFLKSVVEEVEAYLSPAESPVRLVPHYTATSLVSVTLTPALLRKYDKNPSLYPSLKDAMHDSRQLFQSKTEKMHLCIPGSSLYEWIVFTGGEGVIVKSFNGLYHQKRGREYQKIKAFLTREVIIMDFMEPTREYKGKLPESWPYWENGEAVTKYYAEKWVGNIRFGVVIYPDEVEKLPKSKKFNYECMQVGNTLQSSVIELGECSGFDEEQRAEFTKNRAKYIGSVVEVKANMIFPDTGRMRHPRFLRCRSDKNPESCTWAEYMDGVRADE